MTDAGESTDVIDAREAANISAATPGRAFARLGHSSLIPFQTGRVGGRRPLADRAAAVAPPFLQPVSWLDLGLPAPQRPHSATETDEVTDLSVLVTAIRQANDMQGIAPQRRPWLPPLPLSPVVELATEPVGGASGNPSFSWAVQDLPAQQRQEPVTVDLATFGHLHIVGAPRSGRSAALRTFAAAAASASSVADLHLYGLDCGNGALLPLSRLPHCGAVVQRTESDRAARLLKRLHAEVQERQRLLGEGGFADVAEQRAARPESERLPHIVLLLDRWEGFMGTLSEYDNGALTDLIQTLHREGASAGVHVVIAGDHMLLSGRMSSLCDDKLVLRLSDRSDASLAGLNPRKIPENLPPGRGYRAVSAIETQVALLAADPAGPAQVAAVHALAARLVEREAGVPKSVRPNRIAVLPTQLPFEQAWEMVGTPAPMWALIGVAGDDVEPVGADLLGDQPTFLVAGPSRSGRSTALGVMTESLLRGGCEVVIGAPMNSAARLRRSARSAWRPHRRRPHRGRVRRTAGPRGRSGGAGGRRRRGVAGPAVPGLAEDVRPQGLRQQARRDHRRRDRLGGERLLRLAGGGQEEPARGAAVAAQHGRRRPGGRPAVPFPGRRPGRTGRGPGAPGERQPAGRPDPAAGACSTRQARARQIRARQSRPRQSRPRQPGAVMADLVVKDLQDLVNDLNSLIGQFEGALDFQNDDKGLWGQHNANLSMGDFADNWTVHRDAMVKDMKALRDKVSKVDDSWSQAETQLMDTFQNK